MAPVQALFGIGPTVAVCATSVLVLWEYSSLTSTVGDFGLAQNVTGVLADAQEVASASEPSILAAGQAQEALTGRLGDLLAISPTSDRAAIQLAPPELTHDAARTCRC